MKRLLRLLERTDTGSDNRILQERRAIAARGFGILYWGITILLLYRQFILDQPGERYLDIFLLWMVGNSYILFASFSWGTMGKIDLAWMATRIIPVIAAIILLLELLRGNVNSPSDAIASVVSSVVGAVPVFFVFYLLYWLWLKRHKPKN